MSDIKVAMYDVLTNIVQPAFANFLMEFLKEDKKDGWWSYVVRQLKDNKVKKNSNEDIEKIKREINNPRNTSREDVLGKIREIVTAKKDKQMVLEETIKTITDLVLSKDVEKKIQEIRERKDLDDNNKNKEIKEVVSSNIKNQEGLLDKIGKNIQSYDFSKDYFEKIESILARDDFSSEDKMDKINKIIDKNEDYCGSIEELDITHLCYIAKKDQNADKAHIKDFIDELKNLRDRVAHSVAISNKISKNDFRFLSHFLTKIGGNEESINKIEEYSNKFFPLSSELSEPEIENGNIGEDAENKQGILHKKIEELLNKHNLSIYLKGIPFSEYLESKHRQYISNPNGPLAKEINNYYESRSRELNLIERIKNVKDFADRTELENMYPKYLRIMKENVAKNQKKNTPKNENEKSSFEKKANIRQGIYNYEKSNQERITTFRSSPKKECFINGVSCSLSDLESYLVALPVEQKYINITIYYENREPYKKIRDSRNIKLGTLNANINTGELRGWQEKGITGIKLEINTNN